jgi:ATP-dependent DNA ligase
MWALTQEEMKNCRWLKPKLVAQIEFAEWTPDNHLRHSKFIGLREDKEAREVLRGRKLLARLSTRLASTGSSPERGRDDERKTPGR